MPARSIGTATISFGLVSVPVHVYSSAESTSAVSFNLLHKKCGTRVKQQYTCPKDNEIVPRDEMARGYEFAKDQYVVFSGDELKALEEKATNTIDIAEFVPLAKVDRIYLEKVYFLGPDKGGDRAYKLLAQALGEAARVLRPGGYLYVSEPVYAGAFNEVIRLFNDEGAVRAAAQAALDAAMRSGVWEQVAERHFEMPVRFSDFADFEQRMMRPTYADHRIDEAKLAEVRTAFEPHCGAAGARFNRPMHVRLLRRCG